MERIKEDFSIPEYITDEIEEYKELKNKGADTSSKIKNIIALLDLAIFNNRLSKQQVKQIINTLCQEK